MVSGMEADVKAPPSPHELYRQYDSDKSNGISRAELEQMLRDLDGLDGVNPKQEKEYVDIQFDRADLNGDGLISLDEFVMYYYAELCFRFPVQRNGHNPGARLYNIFTNYCSQGKGGKRCEDMDSHSFSQMCRNVKLLLPHQSSSMDVIFHAARSDRVIKKKLGATKLQYKQFLHALLLVAEKRKMGFEQVTQMIVNYGGPKAQPTCADFVIFRAEEYQGDDLDDSQDIPAIKFSRKAARAGKETAHIPSTWDDSISESVKPGSVSVRPVSQASSAPVAKVEAGAVPAAKEGSVAGATSALDAATPSGQAVSFICDAADREGPQGHASQALQSRLEHKFVKTHASVEHLEPISSESPTFRFDRQEWNFNRLGCIDLGSKGDEAMRDSGIMWKVHHMNQDDITMALKRVFEKYNKTMDSDMSRMDARVFGKVLRDTRLVTIGDKTGKIFNKVRPSSESSINFIQFIEALRHVALENRVSLNEVFEIIVACGGPKSQK